MTEKEAVKNHLGALKLSIVFSISGFFLNPIDLETKYLTHRKRLWPHKSRMGKKMVLFPLSQG